MAAYWGSEENYDQTQRLMDVVEGDEDPTPPFAVVEFLNLEQDHIFDKVQCRKGGIARQVLENAVIQMKATYSPAQLSGIFGWVAREEEAARLCGDTNNYVPLMKDAHEIMNLAENFDPEKGPIPIPEYIDGREYRTLTFYVDLGKVYEGRSQPVFKLAKTDTAVRNRFKIAIKLQFLDREEYICESPTFRCRTRRRVEPRNSTSEASTPSPPGPEMPPHQQQSPQSPPVSPIRSLITDSLVARTAQIDDLVYGSMSSPNHDIAYHLKIKDQEIGAELEEGDVVGFFTDDEDEGETYVKLLRSDDIENAVHAGVVSRSFYLAANKMPEDEGMTETVCVIGIVNVKVIGSVENGERIYASIDRPGKAIPQSHLPVGSFLRRKHVLLGMSMVRKTSKSLDEEHLVQCFVCIVLDVGRQDVLHEVENMYEVTEQSTKEQIRYASKKAWRRLRCCFTIGLVIFALLLVLLYQVFVPGSMFRYWLCRRGSAGGDIRVTVVPFSSITTRISVHGVRFTYDGLKEKVPDHFNRNHKTGHRSSVYYFLNLDRCAYFGDKGPVRDWLSGKYKDIGGGKILSINYNCSTVYWYGLLKNLSALGQQWYPYVSAEGLECMPNPPYR